MKGGRGVLFLIVFLFALLTAGNLIARCNQQPTPASTENGGPPVCTSTVSCELPSHTVVR